MAPYVISNKTHQVSFPWTHVFGQCTKKAVLYLENYLKYYCKLCFFFISVKGSCINLIVAIISCPGVFSEQFMPPRGAKPQLESLMQISWLNVQPANMPFFFQCKAYHLTKCSPINIKKRIMKKGKLISWEVFSWLIHQIPPTNQPENV